MLWGNQRWSLGKFRENLRTLSTLFWWFIELNTRFTAIWSWDFIRTLRIIEGEGKKLPDFWWISTRKCESYNWDLIEACSEISLSVSLYPQDYTRDPNKNPKLSILHHHYFLKMLKIPQLGHCSKDSWTFSPSNFTSFVTVFWRFLHIRNKLLWIDVVCSNSRQTLFDIIWIEMKQHGNKFY